MTQQYTQTKSSLQDFFSVLKKRKLAMLIIFLSIISGTVAITLTQTPIYEITSTVMIKYGREYIYRPMDRLEKGEVQPMLTFDNTRIINTELEIYRSKELIEKTISSIGIDRLYPKLASPKDSNDTMLSYAINSFKNNFSVFHIKESSVIGISFQHKDPELAVEAVNLLTDFFKEKHIQLFKNPQAPFLEKQVTQYTKLLENAGNNLKTFKQENQIFSLEAQRKLLLEQYINVNTLLIKGTGDASKLSERVTSLKTGLESMPEEVVLFDESVQNSNIDDARSKLLELQLFESELLEKYKEDNRLVIAVRKDIKKVNTFISKQHLSQEKSTRTGKNYTYLELQKELILAEVDFKAQQAKNDSTRQQLGQLSKQLQDFAAKEKELKKLELEVEAAEENYTNFSSKLEETRILDEMDRQKMVNVSVIEKPMVPIKPIKPRKKLNLLIGIILGITSSFTYALVADYYFSQKP
ncbi:MAG: GumC family protein [Thermodesulfobacteriota bacterium]|nr:GumC family protein [Thermodesulfobacteriota bacterium]